MPWRERQSCRDAERAEPELQRRQWRAGGAEGQTCELHTARYRRKKPFHCRSVRRQAGKEVELMEDWDGNRDREEDEVG